MANSTPYLKGYLKQLEEVGEFKIGTRWIAKYIPFIKEVPFEIIDIHHPTGRVTYDYIEKGRKTRYLSELKVALKNGVIRPYKD